MVGVNVAEDAIVLAKARVTKRDDRISLIANDLVVPDLAQASGPAGIGPEGIGQPVTVSMLAARCTPEWVARLKDVLARHPGTQEVKALLGPGCLS